MLPAYGKKVIAEHLSLQCRSERITALLGHNGAGKTSILRLLAGTRPPHRGRVTIGSLPATDVVSGDPHRPAGGDRLSPSCSPIWRAPRARRS